jgi:hypothetical protein
MPGGGVFLTLDSGPGRYAEVSYEFVRTELFDVFWFEIVPEPDRPAERKSGGARGSGDGTAGGGALPFPA